MKTIEKVVEGHEEQVTGPKINAHRLDECGREIVDGRPMQPPVGYVEQPSIFEQMRAAMVEASLRAASMGMETEEEANDFYIEDDPESGVPPSQYQYDEDHVLEEMASRMREDYATATESNVVSESPGSAGSSSVKPPKGGKPTPEPSSGGSEGGA